MIVINVPNSVYPLGFFFIPFPNFFPLFGLYCVRRYYLRFFIVSEFHLNPRGFPLHFVLLYFISLYYTLWLFQSVLGTSQDVLGSYYFICILLYHRQRQKFSVPFRLLQYFDAIVLSYIL